LPKSCAAVSNLTKSEKAVADYMLTHLKSLPYETAASISRAVDHHMPHADNFTVGIMALVAQKERHRARPQAGVIAARPTPPRS